MKYSFHPSAKKELNEAIDYYNDCQDKLGLESSKEVYKSIQIILQFPQAWSQLSKNTRRCLVNRFPYNYSTHKHKNSQPVETLNWLQV